MAWIFYEETIYTFRRPQPRESLWAKVKPYLVGAMLGVTLIAILYALAVVHSGPNGSPRPVPAAAAPPAPFDRIDPIVADVRAGRTPETARVSEDLRQLVAQGDAGTLRVFLDSINAKLRPLGKAGTFERGEFRIITR